MSALEYNRIEKVVCDCFRSISLAVTYVVVDCTLVGVDDVESTCDFSLDKLKGYWGDVKSNKD